MGDKYLAFQAILDADAEYQAHRQEHILAKEQFQQILCQLKPTHKEIMYEYLGALAEMQMREIELALMLQLQ